MNICFGITVDLAEKHGVDVEEHLHATKQKPLEIQLIHQLIGEL